MKKLLCRIFTLPFAQVLGWLVRMLSQPRSFLTLLFVLSWSATLNAAEIAAGPMVGAPEARAMPLWVQLDAPAEVSFAYWPAGQPGKRATTPTAGAIQANAYVVELEAGPLEAGTEYEYEVLIDGRAATAKAEQKFTTAPFYLDRMPPPDFTVAVGSGHRVNDEPYDPLNRKPGDGYDIFLAILAKQPAFMLWTGNNINLRQADWGSRSGMLARYGKNRAQPELQPLLAAVPQAAVISQGDFGPANSGKHFRGRETALEVAELFWANPPVASSADSLATSFTYGDAEFFLLDDRSQRELEFDINKKAKVLGDAQLEWLRHSLRESAATFKVVVTGSPMLNPSDSPRNHKVAKFERDRLLEYFKDDQIEGLVIVTGGKDYGELTKMVRAGAPDLYELSMGPLTDRPTESTKEMNFYRVPSTGTYQRQFALLDFHGPEGARELTITMCDSLGEKLWTQTIPQQDMIFK